MKLASVGQSIMQAVQPRSIIAPLQLGLGLQMYHHFASQFLINTLHEHGFTCSYPEVQKYEQNAAVSKNSIIPKNLQEHDIQFIADNVDHNVATIDGTGTFHGMCIVAALTPKFLIPHTPITKVTVTAEEIAHVGRINIENFKIPVKLPPLTYLPLRPIVADDPTCQLDVLWKTFAFSHANMVRNNANATQWTISREVFSDISTYGRP